MTEISPNALQRPDFPFDVVGFDLDGTLLNTAPDLAEALNHVLAQAGRPPATQKETLTYVGGGTRMMLERALAATGGPLPEEQFKALLPQLLTHYEAHISRHTKPYPGMEATLEALAARGVKLALVTNKLEHLARKLLGELGLTHHFYTIIGGDTLGPGRAKPAPDLLQLMIERSGLTAPRTVYIGDTHFDTNAAKAAGLPVVAVSFGFSSLPVDTLGADAVIDHFDALIPTLENLSAINA